MGRRFEPKRVERNGKFHGRPSPHVGVCLSFQFFPGAISNPAKSRFNIPIPETWVRALTGELILRSEGRRL